MHLAIRNKQENCRVQIRKSHRKALLQQRRRSQALSPVEFFSFARLRQFFENKTQFRNQQFLEELRTASANTSKLSQAELDYFLTQLTEIFKTKTKLPAELIQFTSQLFFHADDPFKYEFVQVETIVKEGMRRMAEEEDSLRILDVLANVSYNRNFVWLVQPLAGSCVYLSEKANDPNIQESLFIIFNNICKRSTKAIAESLYSSFQNLVVRVQNSIRRSEERVRLAGMLGPTRYLIERHPELAFEGSYFFWNTAVDLIDCLTGKALVEEWGKMMLVFVEKLVEQKDFTEYFELDIDYLMVMSDQLKNKESAALPYLLKSLKLLIAKAYQEIGYGEDLFTDAVNSLIELLQEGVHQHSVVAVLYEFVKAQLMYDYYDRPLIGRIFKVVAFFIIDFRRMPGAEVKSFDRAVKLLVRVIQGDAENKAKHLCDLGTWGLGKALEGLAEGQPGGLGQDFLQKYLNN